MIKKINVEDLQVGMFVEDFNVSWLDHPFLTSRKRLKSAREIQILVDQGIRSVYIDTALGSDSPKAVPAEEASREESGELLSELSQDSPSAEAPLPPSRPPDTSYREELRRAESVYATARTVVQDLLHDARLGRSIDGRKATAVVDQMVDSIFRNPDALQSLSRLKSFDEYTFQHSVNVSVLSLALGRHLGILKDELKRLGVGALLHDVGKMMVPTDILNKPGRLTEREFELVRTHTLHGAKLLMECSEVPDDCAAVALNHHERFGGRGYPRGLQGLSIGKFGLIAAIVDVYDAITSTRVYHAAMSSHEAVKKIYEWGKTDFYPIYVHRFIRCLGIYPVGSAVRLDTGEVGVVCRQNSDQLLRPVVRLVRGRRGETLGAPLDVDLCLPHAEGRRPYARTIAETLDPHAEAVPVEAILAREARLEER